MTKTNETIYEAAKDTAKKIRRVLKERFPQTKFSVTSDRDSVNVHWTDGPMKPEIEKILDQYKSLGPSDMSDYRPITGYILDGQRYVGASYLNASRTLTAEYKTLLVEQAQKMGFQPDIYGHYNVRQLNDAERALLGEEDTNEDTEGPCGPGQENLMPNKVVDLDTRRITKFLQTCSPEQYLKALILSKLLGDDQVAAALGEGKSIDELFTRTAEAVYSQGIRFPE